MTRLRDPQQLAALQRQVQLEKAATEARNAAHAALLAAMPEDLRGLYQLGLGFDYVAGLLKRGMFPNDTHESVREAHEFMHKHVMHVDAEIVGHPRFAEFFPAQAAKAEARRVQAEALDVPAVQLVGPDGAPLDLAPAPGIVHVGEIVS